MLTFLDVLIACMEYGFRTAAYRRPTLTRRYFNITSHHPYNVWRGIAQCLKYRAKNISSGLETRYEKKLIQLSNNLLSSIQPQNIISTPFRKSQNIGTHKLTNVCLPYAKGLLEKIKNIRCPFDIRTAFKRDTILCKYLLRVQLKTAYIPSHTVVVCHIKAKCSPYHNIRGKEYRKTVK